MSLLQARKKTSADCNVLLDYTPIQDMNAYETVLSWPGDFRRMSVPVGSFGHSERVPTADNSYRGIAETLAAKLFELSKSVGDARNPGSCFATNGRSLTSQLNHDMRQRFGSAAHDG